MFFGQSRSANRTSRSSCVLVFSQAKNLSTFFLTWGQLQSQICFPMLPQIFSKTQPKSVTSPEAANEDVPEREEKTPKIWSSATSFSSWQWNSPWRDLAIVNYTPLNFCMESTIEVPQQFFCTWHGQCRTSDVLYPTPIRGLAPGQNIAELAEVISQHLSDSVCPHRILTFK